MDSRIDWLKEDLNSIKQDMKEIDSKIDQLLEFKFKVIGGTLALSAVITLLFQIINIMIGK